MEKIQVYEGGFLATVAVRENRVPRKNPSTGRGSRRTPEILMCPLHSAPSLVTESSCSQLVDDLGFQLL